MEQFYINTLEEKGVDAPSVAIKWLYKEWEEWDLILRNEELRTSDFLVYYSKLTFLVLNLKHEESL